MARGKGRKPPPYDFGEFEGYEDPRYTQIPDELLDLHLPELTGAELKVLLYVMRHTYGFKKVADTISLSQLQGGYTKKSGVIGDRGTGLSRQGVVNATKSLIKKGLIEKETQETPQGDADQNVYRVRRRGVVNSVDHGSQKSNPGGSQLSRPTRDTEGVLETPLSLARLLATTMGHDKPPKRIERECLGVINELLEAGERPEDLARGIPLLPKHGDVYGPGFLVTKWPQIKDELVAMDEAGERAQAQRAVDAAADEEQAANDAARVAIEKLPPDELEQLRTEARESNPSALRDAGDDHPALWAAMVHLWRNRDVR